MIPGIFSSQGGINAERLDSFNSKLFRSQLAGTAPIFALSSGSAQFQLTSKIHYWFMKQPYSSKLIASAAANNTAASITVDKGAVVEPSSVIMNTKTNEYMFVSAVSGNTLTVVRGFAESTAAAVTQNDELLYLGTAKKEGSLAPNPKYRRGVPRMNYSQIFRNGWGTTRTAEYIKFITGNKATENKEDAVSMHAQDIEMALLLGRKSLNQVDGSEVLSTMDGLMSIVKNNTALVAAATLDSIQEWMYSNFETCPEGVPNERVVMTSLNVLYILNKLIRDAGSSYYPIGTATKVYGLDVYALQLPGMQEVKILAHPLFSQTESLSKSMLIYHPGLIKIGYMTDAEIKDATPVGMDGQANVITSELTLEYADENTGGVLSNIYLA
jgi:hypothetical protein|nr:MAG TPA: major capsid protein [Caudoviricetes sp.]